MDSLLTFTIVSCFGLIGKWTTFQYYLSPTLLLLVTSVILYLTGLNYHGLLKPYFSPYIDVYVLAMWFYITSGTKKSDFNFFICVLKQFKHAESK